MEQALVTKEAAKSPPQNRVAIARRRFTQTELWAALAAVFEPAQSIELIMLAGQYHGISFLLNSLRIEREPGTPRWGTDA